MATRRPSADRGPVRTTNPIAHVVYQAGDLSGIDITGGGGKELIEVTPELRGALRTNVARVTHDVAVETAVHPDIPSVLVIKLREIAIAKSHRPTEMAFEAGMPPAGHGSMDEMLVAANAISLTQLDHVIANRNTKVIRSNLSAVAGFEAWGIQRRLPRFLRGKALPEVYQELVALNRRLMVRLFSHRSEATTTLVIERLQALLAALQTAYFAIPQRVGPPIFVIEMNEALTLDALSTLLAFQGIRGMQPEPHAWPTMVAPMAGGLAVPAAPRFTAHVPSNVLPLVGVFDTGVDPATVAMQPWVVSRDTYVLPPDTDYVHGTAVGSLIVDCTGLNGSHPVLPATPCRIHDACALEINGSRISDLILRLRETVSERTDIKVWNLSLGASEITDDEFSDFGRELDALSDAHGVLFVVAAGNYVDLPRRSWPVNGAVLKDRISSPGDAVRALTVGALTHLESEASLVKIGEPAPYSRRGPGPVFTPKPDLVHIGGNADANLSSEGIGINVMTPGVRFASQCGTSFAAPIVTAMAAHAWQALEMPGRAQPLHVTPNMVKALLIHSAQLNSPERSAVERRYFGAGLPSDATNILYDSDSSFTMLFELDIADTTKWRKAPFPIPSSLIRDGKLCGEVIITATYAPPLNPAAGAEYVRVNVDVGFGTLDPGANGRLQFKGQVPAEGELGTNGYEEAQVEYGGKWSPVKTYRRAFPKGKAGNTWALQATIVRRAYEPPLAQPLRVVILLTLRALDDNRNIYEEGRRALAATNWITQNLTTRIPVSVQA